MRWGTVLAGAFVFLVAADAAAADTWTTPHPGVRHLRRTTGTPWRIFALEIDLCHDGVALRATKSGERQRTVSSFAALVDAEAAINGDFFSYTDYSTSGLAVGGGEPWTDTTDTGDSGFVAFGRGRAEVWAPNEALAEPASWMRDVVSGKRPLVRDGVVYPQNEGDLCTVRHPRTAAGLSADGRTLILAVVDGRSTSSAGMTCTELGALMKELGAHDASNLDGGGSTTMWIAGDGVVNSPSDGAQRVVGNHLSVQASGANEPGSCDRSWEEAGLHSDAQGGSTSSDIDGDGMADLCARAGAGIRCRLAADDFVADVVGPEWSDALGWDDPANWSTLRTGDIDGDGRADLCARADDGIICRTSVTGVLADAVEGPALDDASGFGDASRWSTLRMADTSGDGRDDLCAMTDAGFACWRAEGDAFASEPIVIADLVALDRPSLYGSIRTGDVDADGRTDVCARREDGISCWHATESGFGAATSGPAWSDANGWDRVEYWSTIRMVDVDGDRRSDLCARAAAGLVCHLSTGDGWSEPIAGPTWSDDSGWWDYANYSSIRFGDLDGDGDHDVCARANAGIRCSMFADGAFGASFDGPALADDGGWGSIRFFSTLRLADIDGDGMADLCGRAQAGVQCWPSTGTEFAAVPIMGPGWSDESGWDAPQYYATMRMSTPAPRCHLEERCDDGIDDDCDGEIDEGCDDGSDDDTGTGGGSTAGDAGESDPSGGAASDSGATDTDALPTTFGEDAAGDGCACAAQPQGGAFTLLVLAYPLSSLARRRRRARRHAQSAPISCLHASLLRIDPCTCRCVLQPDGNRGRDRRHDHGDLECHRRHHAVDDDEHGHERRHGSHEPDRPDRADGLVEHRSRHLRRHDRPRPGELRQR
jgi:hypothetical protein